MSDQLNLVSNECWRENSVALTEPSVALVNEFGAILDDARAENPLQIFLANNPVILRSLLPPSRKFWCFDRPRFGNQFIPDFLLCSEYSTGYNWTPVELESPTKRALISNGRISAALAEAIGQINDWRIWLRKNISYTHAELGFKELDAECSSIIVIGRRAQLDPKNICRYRELSKNNLTVMTFDRVVDSARTVAK